MVLPGLSTIFFKLEAGLVFDLLHGGVENAFVIAGDSPLEEVRDLSSFPPESFARVHCTLMSSISGQDIIIEGALDLLINFLGSGEGNHVHEKASH